MLAIRCCDLFGASGPTRLLIDCGDVDEDDARRYVDRLEAVMRQHGVTGLAGVIATHAHIDHIGGMGLCLPLPLTFHPLTTHHPPPPPLPPGITHPPLHPRTIPPTACAVPFVPAAPPMPFFCFFFPLADWFEPIVCADPISGNSHLQGFTSCGSGSARTYLFTSGRQTQRR